MPEPYRFNPPDSHFKKANQRYSTRRGGRFWGRTHCSEDSDSKFTSGTGDCGSGKIECAGAGATPPATLAKFTIGVMDMFYVSLVGGYNLLILVSPTGGSGGNCTLAGCTVDLNGRCPPVLKVVGSDGEVVGCKSGCVAFGREEDCCRGAYGSREACKPSSYSQVFKTACPHASSYAYDDETSTFTVLALITRSPFAPRQTTSKFSLLDSKKSKGEQQNPTTPQFNTGMVYEGTSTAGNSSGTPLQSTYIRAIISVVVVIVVIILVVGGYAIRTGNVNNLNGSCNQF